MLRPSPRVWRRLSTNTCRLDRRLIVNSLTATQIPAIHCFSSLAPRHHGPLAGVTSRSKASLAYPPPSEEPHYISLFPTDPSAPHLHRAPTTPVLNPVPRFDRTDIAYASKSTGELLRAALSFSLCQFPPLVKHSEEMLKWTRRIFGNTFTDALLQATLYGHFCAGPDEKGIQPVVHAMKQAGVGSILDYAAEGDGMEDNKKSTPFPKRKKKTQFKSKEEELAALVFSENNPNIRTYEYTTEAACDAHVKTFQNCIRDVAALGEEDGFAALKVTALVDPQLLARLSRVILQVQTLFHEFDQDRDGYVSRDEFLQGVEKYFQDPDHVLETMFQAELETQGKVDYLSWSLTLRHDTILPQILALCRTQGPLAQMALDEAELAQLQRLYGRMHAVAEQAAATQTRLLVDAEQALYQPAIDSIVLDLQKEYNSGGDVPIIYNTYQCYLKDSTKRLETDFERSERLGYHFGAKLVRGAYMESERALARKMGFASPVHDTIQDTHKAYDASVRFLLEQSQNVKNSDKKVEVMLASHNQDSIQQAVSVMNELGIDRSESTICFAQLFGMMDHVTYALGQYGYRAYKYVPYGEVQLVMPYLVRRAKENSSISGGARQELDLLWTELKRRAFG